MVHTSLRPMQGKKDSTAFKKMSEFHGSLLKNSAFQIVTVLWEMDSTLHETDPVYS